MDGTRGRLILIALVVVVGAMTAGCDKSKDDAAEAIDHKALATEHAAMIGDGALVYYQEEHMTDPTGMEVVTKVYPEAPTRICTSDDASAELFEALRYEAADDIEVCYQSGADQKAFAASATSGDITRCVTGGVDETTTGPRLSAPIEVDSADDCTP